MNNQEIAPQDTINETEKQSAESVCCGIYGLRNKVNNKWYVGQSLDVMSRFSNYQKLQCKRQPKLYNALKKYGYDEFEKVILEKCSDVKWIMDYREMYWIRYLNSFMAGYNLTEGGYSTRLSAEAKEKIRQSLIGKKQSPETREKRRVSNTGRKYSAESARKKSLSNMGKKHTEAGRLAISEGTKLAMQRPEVKEKVSAGIKANWTKERTEKLREQSKRLWQTPEFILKMKARKHGSGMTGKYGNLHHSYGKPRSEETKRKITETKLKKKLALIAASSPLQPSPNLLVQ